MFCASKNSQQNVLVSSQFIKNARHVCIAKRHSISCLVWLLFAQNFVAFQLKIFVFLSLQGQRKNKSQQIREEKGFHVRILDVKSPSVARTYSKIGSHMRPTKNATYKMSTHMLQLNFGTCVLLCRSTCIPSVGSV